MEGRLWVYNNGACSKTELFSWTIFQPFYSYAVLRQMVIVSMVQNFVLLYDEDEQSNFIANNVKNVICTSFCNKTLKIFHHIESSSIVWFKCVDIAYFPTHMCTSLEPTKLMEFQLSTKCQSQSNIYRRKMYEPSWRFLYPKCYSPTLCTGHICKFLILDHKQNIIYFMSRCTV